MKIKKTTKYANKLLNLKLINSKIYNQKQHQDRIKLEDISSRLKKSIFIIYKYNLFNKRILFIGMPAKIALKLLSIFGKDTRHVFVPKSIWARGAISDRKACFKHLAGEKKTLNTHFYQTLLQLKQQMDLVVIFDEANNEEIINESYLSRIPIISLNSNLKIKLNKPSYKIPGNFQFNNKKIRENIFYSLLITTLKKSIKSKKNGFEKNK